uniref:SLC3A2_N domain-containing protein n=1 Tax=Ascaris lumbricoides TaxID=6252 RepID=A0A0M3ISD4_ASCLU
MDLVNGREERKRETSSGKLPLWLFGWLACAGLILALPPILEPLSWMIGRWETETTSQEHFPVPLSAPYREVLDISISEVPMFDRPPVNISLVLLLERILD